MFAELYIGLTSIFTFVFSFIVSSLINKIIIKYQRRKIQGQAISKYLFDHHQEKKLTPTFGGVAIFLSVIFSTLIFYECYKYQQFRIVLIVMFSYFLIGFIDDYIKVNKKNYLGLSSSIRFFLEFLIAILAYLYLENHYDFTHINLFGDNKIYVGSLIILVFPLVLVGCANSVNLTDGLDGLSSSLFLLAIIPFIIFSLISREYYLTYLLIASFGSVLGFIAFNLHPSKIFMGVSGSLSLGGLLGISAIILHREAYLLIGGAVFVFETLSVIIQVIFFKLTKKRFFLMAPFHHHLELKGYKEYQIVMYFFMVGLVCSFISIFIGMLS